MAKRLTLGKKERLKSRKAIETLFSRGKTIKLLPYRVLFLFAEKGLQFGVGVSAKSFKKAPDRNRIKRLTREAWRLQKIPLQELLQSQNKGMNIFLMYASQEPASYPTVRDAVQKILTKLMKITNETGASDT
jgi:ribonuclease P protein component